VLRPAPLDATLIGQALPWDLYSSAGVLVAPAGILISGEREYERLVERALFIRSQADLEGDGPGTILMQIVDRLHALVSGPVTPELAEHLSAIARELAGLQRADADAAFGLSRVLPIRNVGERHCLMTAVVASYLAEPFELDDADHFSLVAAGLSMNVAEMSLHADLERGFKGYGDAERRRIREHPIAGVTWLKQAGVEDARWLAAVAQHHENMDGTGYPYGLVGGEITLIARLLRVADYFVARLNGRVYRQALSPAQAMKQLFHHDRHRLDRQISAVLLRRLGEMPPGSIVRLANSETALVTRYSDKRGGIRHVVSFLDARGVPLPEPGHSDLSLSSHAIRRIVQPEPTWPNLDWQALWGYA